MVHREDPDARDSELDPRNGRVYGPNYANGNGNGTASKMLWAAAGFAFMIAAYLVGVQLAQIGPLQSELARVQEHLSFIDREVERLQTQRGSNNNKE